MSTARISVVIVLALELTSTKASADDSTDQPNGSGDLQARPHCVGWALVGGFSGGVVGLGAGALVAGAVGGRRSMDSVGSGVAMVTGNLLGITLFPIVTCKWSDDPRTVPAASFLIGGGIVGSAALVVPTYFAYSATAPKSDDASLAGLLLLAAAGIGTVGGGYLGWRLHKSREPSSAEPVAKTGWMAAPSLSRGGGGVAVYGAF